MEIDLAADGAPRETVRSTVCVVGAGIVGLVLARRLARLGVNVVVLEAGGRSIEDDGQRLFAAARLTEQEHKGTREGRFRVFGGASLRWGGQLLGMSREAAAEWPVAWEELAKFSAVAEGMLGVDALPFEGAEFFRAVGTPMPSLFAELDGVEARVSKWMGFSRRNLAATMGRELIAEARARVYLHAPVTEVVLAESGARVAAVKVRDGAGREVRFEAEHFVLAVGTVETSRLLLASRSVAKGGVGNGFGLVGRGFHDHVTLPVAKLTGAARERVLRELRPWVVGGTVHSVKLEASVALRARLGLNQMLAHVVIEEPEGTGVAAVREMLTAMQRGELRKVAGDGATRIPAAAVEALKLGWEAKVRGRRFVSKDAVVKLQFNVAQDAATASRVTLSEVCDANGMPQAVVDWRVSEGEVASLRGYAGYLKERFDAMGLAGVEWVPEMLAPDAALPGLDDARHAMGGARMGADPRSSVVDAELTVHGVENLSIAGGATFPTGGAQLPTLTMAALALRLAERIAGRVRR